MTSARILIATNKQTTRESLSKSLATLGYVVGGVFASCEDVFRVAGVECPDLILVDLSLEGEIDGIETGWRIQDELNIPVIYLASDNDVQHLSRANAARSFGYIFEPCSEQQLAAVIETALYRHAQENRLAESENNLKTIVEGPYKELEEQHRFFRQVIDANPNLILVRDRQSRFVLVNEEAAEYFGTTPEELAGKVETDTNFSLEQAERFMEEDRKVMDTLQGVYRSEEEVYFPDGRKRHLQVSKRPLIGPDGKADRVLVVLADSTERVLAEKALQESEKRFRDIAFSTSDWIWEVDHQGRYTHCSERVQDILGYTPGEVIGKTPFDFMPPDEVARASVIFQENFEKQQPIVDLENWNVNREGQMVCLLTNGVPVFSEDGALAGYRGVDKNITERKKSEEALKHSEKHYRELVEKAGIAVLIDDRDGNFSYVNQAFADIFGYTIEGVMQESTATVIHPDDMSIVRRYHEERVSGDKAPLRYIIRGVRKDGEIRHLEVVAVADRSAGPNRGTFAYLWDVTERVQVEEALWVSDTKFRGILERSKDGIILTDEQGLIVDWNQSTEAIIGLSSDDVLGRYIADVLHPLGPPETLTPECYQALDKNFREALEKGRSPMLDQLIEADYRQTNGVSNKAQEMWFSVKTEKGYMLGAIIRDITEIRQAGEALRASEMQYRAVVDDQPGMIYRYRLDGTITFANELCGEFFGKAPEALVGQNLYEMIEQSGAETADNARQQIVCLTPENPVSVHEHEMVNTNGELFWFQWIDRLLLDENDVPLEIQVLGYDLTERKQMEDAVIEAQKLAALGTLAAGMAHEINSPLQVITGTSESLLRRVRQSTLNPDELPDNLERINRSAWRVAQIVRSLLTYARPSAEAAGSHDLNNIVKDTLLLIEHQLRTWSNITVVTELAPDLPSLHCDHEKVSQIILNLLTNARDAMPKGGQITIRTRYDKQDNRVLFEVEDSGHGITEEVRARIFDPFYTTKPVGKGTGLGLSIVRGIVQAHGGEIFVESEVNQGTTISIFLPEVPPSTSSANSPDRYGRYQ
jgi:PAS domain S-box-containing protein